MATTREERNQRWTEDPTRCVANNRQGKRCGKSPEKGGRVCRMHGGAAPQTQQANARRILEALITPALIEYRRILESPNVSDAVKMQAIRDLLDRTGYKAATTVEVITQDAVEREIARLEAELALND